MKKLSLLAFLFLISLTFNACNDSDDDYAPVSPVVMDLTQVPLPKLSDYKFFEGDLKNMQPAYGVLPYKPASELFTDYAHKKRFVWMPAGEQATFNGNDNALEFPVGAALIKNFYYEHVLPSNTQRIIETRIMVKIAEATPTVSGWKFYNYIWNDEQTEAFLDVTQNGGPVEISFVENGETKTTNYRIPSGYQCVTCHKLIVDGNEIAIPVGVKPQNLNNTYDYGTSQRNQLQKWVSAGYLENAIPSDIHSTVDWKDTSKSLEERARSYIDINCAHCHREGAHCDYVAMRFNYSNPDLNIFGVCMTPIETVEDRPYVITAGSSEHSELIYRISSEDESVMMPIMGRTLVHTEAVALIKDWINSMETSCD